MFQFTMIMFCDTTDSAVLGLIIWWDFWQSEAGFYTYIRSGIIKKKSIMSWVSHKCYFTHH